MKSQKTQIKQTQFVYIMVDHNLLTLWSTMKIFKKITSKYNPLTNKYGPNSYGHF